jgi:hypothetical protein
VTRSLVASAMAARLSGRRVRLVDLRAAALDRDSSLLGDPDQRERLRDALDELVAAGLVALPAPGGRAWDRGRIDLPHWVTVTVAPPSSTPRVEPRWHARLHGLPALLRERAASDWEWELLLGVQEFLRTGQGRFAAPGRVDDGAVVPMAERLLELAGDEKLLRGRLETRLFRHGVLSLELLRARTVPDPGALPRIGPGPVTLVVENAATVDSLQRSLPAHGEVGRVVWGRGQSLPSVLAGLAAESEPPQALRYFGDLDPPGVSFPGSAHTTLVALGLPPLLPAARLYRVLLQVGTPRPDRTRARRTVPLDWLPADVRSEAARLFGARQRLAQEWLGHDHLRAHDLTDLG